MQQSSEDTQGRQRSQDIVDTATRINQTKKAYDYCNGVDRDPLLESPVKFYGSVEEGPSAQSPSPVETPTTIYKSRFWIIIIFSLLCWVHCLEWIVWGSISESMNAAFSGWGAATVTFMVNWGTIMFVVCVVPMCWAMQRYGLRAGVLACAAMLVVSTVLRCITKKTPLFTILCHLSAVFIGISATLVLSAPTMIASEWFPVQERTTAMAIMVSSHQLGGVGSYLVPLLVRLPGPQVSPADIQNDVMHVNYIGAGLAVAVLAAVILYFPSKPPTPPSLSSTTQRVRFLPGLLSLLKNKRFLVLMLSYGVFVGPAVVWLTIMDYSLLPLGFHQDKAMWVGIGGMVSSSLAPILSGLVNDRLQGHIKTMLILLMLAATAFFFWFLLLSYGVLPVTDWQIYASAIGGLSLNYAAVPLFFEVGIDLAYPVPEVLVTGMTLAADNIVGIVFLLLFNTPNIGFLWITVTLTLTSALPILPLLALRFDSTRTDIDTRQE